MSYCVLFCALYGKESANKRYRNTVNSLISLNTVSQNNEKPHTAELQSSTKLLRKCHILRPFFLTFSLYRVLPSPLPLEAMLLCVLKQP